MNITMTLTKEDIEKALIQYVGATNARGKKLDLNVDFKISSKWVGDQREGYMVNSLESAILSEKK